MADVEDVRRWIAYDRMVFDRYVRSAKRLGWRTATRGRGTGHLSVKNTLVHILNVYEAWLVAVGQSRWDVFETPGRRPDEVGSWSGFRGYHARVWRGVDDLLTTITPKDLRRRVRAPWMPGRYTLEDAIHQVSFEQAHHLGEIIAIYWQMDRAPPSMTWIENQPRRRPRST